MSASSQTSPSPSPSASAWSGFGINIQLSSKSKTPSPSESSQTSPSPFPSVSAWSGLNVVGQLSTGLKSHHRRNLSQIVDKIEVTVKISVLFSMDEIVFSELIVGKSSDVSSLTIDLTLNSYTLSESLSRGVEKTGGLINEINPYQNQY